MDAFDVSGAQNLDLVIDISFLKGKMYFIKILALSVGFKIQMDPSKSNA